MKYRTWMHYDLIACVFQMLAIVFLLVFDTWLWLQTQERLQRLNLEWVNILWHAILLSHGAHLIIFKGNINIKIINYMYEEHDCDSTIGFFINSYLFKLIDNILYVHVICANKVIKIAFLTFLYKIKTKAR